MIAMRRRKIFFLLACWIVIASLLLVTLYCQHKKVGPTEPIIEQMSDVLTIRNSSTGEQYSFLISSIDSTQTGDILFETELLGMDMDPSISSIIHLIAKKDLIDSININAIEMPGTSIIEIQPSEKIALTITRLDTNKQILEGFVINQQTSDRIDMNFRNSMLFNNNHKLEKASIAIFWYIFIIYVGLMLVVVLWMCGFWDWLWDQIQRCIDWLFYMCGLSKSMIVLKNNSHDLTAITTIEVSFVTGCSSSCSGDCHDQGGGG